MRGHPARSLAGIKRRTWIRTSALRIVIVDGDAVRKRLYKDFIAGGHDRIYRYVPSGEVWIDDKSNRKDWWHILLHELHERRLMGKGIGYPKAHHSSNAVEGWYQSRGLAAVKRRVKEELEWLTQH